VPMSVRRVGRVAVPLLAVGAALQWWLGLAPVLALVASYVAVLLALSRTLPARVAPAAAVLGVFGSYLLLLVLLPPVVGTPLRPGVALAVLLAPCVAVVADLRGSRPAPERRPVPWLLLAAACGGGLVMVATVVVAGGEPYSAIAWTASGDARNHLMDARGVLADGGLQGRWLTVLPMLQEGLMGLLLDTHGRGTLGPSELFRHDMVAYATTSLALTVLWTFATSALLLGFGPLRRRTAPVLLVASLVPLTGLGLGVLLRDGFVPILLLQPLLLCTLTVLGWLSTVDDDTGTPVTVGIAVTAAAVPLAATTWTPFFAVVGAACALPWLRALRTGRQRPARLALMAAGTLSGSVVCLKVIDNTPGFLSLTGSIAPPTPAAAALPVFLVLAIGAAGWSAVPRRAFVPFAAGSLVTLGIVIYAVVGQPEGMAWNYYPAKVAWLWATVALPMLLLPFAHPHPHPRPGAEADVATGGTTGEKTGERTARGRAALGAVAVLLGGVAFSPVASPLFADHIGWTQNGLFRQGFALGDWEQPDAAALNLVERLGSQRKKYVVYGVDPQEDRITNFWLATYDPYEDSDLIGWAYFEQGRPEDICTILDKQPGRIVATSDPTAEQLLETTCGRDVRVERVRP